MHFQDYIRFSRMWLRQQQWRDCTMYACGHFLETLQYQRIRWADMADYDLGLVISLKKVHDRRGWGCGAAVQCGDGCWESGAAGEVRHYTNGTQKPGTPMGGRLISRLDARAPDNGHRHCDDNGLDYYKDNLRQSNPNKRRPFDGCFRYPTRQRQRQRRTKPTNQATDSYCLHLLRPFCAAPTDVEWDVLLECFSYLLLVTLDAKRSEGSVTGGTRDCWLVELCYSTGRNRRQVVVIVIVIVIRRYISSYASGSVHVGSEMPSQLSLNYPGLDDSDDDGDDELSRVAVKPVVVLAVYQNLSLFDFGSGGGLGAGGTRKGKAGRGGRVEIVLKTFQC
uniref:Uncharacterized protein n=1 Tax=Setaria digitata TaxID=48799 RepID=A0A915PLV9_9BILA